MRVSTGACVEELFAIMKAASNSNPGIIAPPSPGGDGGVLSPKPASPVTPKQLVGKVVKNTNLQKTNYTRPSTNVVTPNPTITSMQKAVPPPVVRS
jgi:hypothetical protein